MKKEKRRVRQCRAVWCWCKKIKIKRDVTDALLHPSLFFYLARESLRTPMASPSTSSSSPPLQTKKQVNNHLNNKEKEGMKNVRSKKEIGQEHSNDGFSIPKCRARTRHRSVISKRRVFAWWCTKQNVQGSFPALSPLSSLSLSLFLRLRLFNPCPTFRAPYPSIESIPWQSVTLSFTLYYCPPLQTKEPPSFLTSQKKMRDGGHMHMQIY